jgi:hypothetical protein
MQTKQCLGRDEDNNIRQVEESSLETIAPGSAEGRRLLTEAVSLLQERLAAPEIGEK